MLLQRFLCCALGPRTGYRAGNFEDDGPKAFPSQVAANATERSSAANCTCDYNKGKYDSHSAGGASAGPALMPLLLTHRWDWEAPPYCRHRGTYRGVNLNAKPSSLPPDDVCVWCYGVTGMTKNNERNAYQGSDMSAFIRGSAGAASLTPDESRALLPPGNSDSWFTRPPCSHPRPCLCAGAMELLNLPPPLHPAVQPTACLLARGRRSSRDCPSPVCPTSPAAETRSTSVECSTQAPTAVTMPAAAPNQAECGLPASRAVATDLPAPPPQPAVHTAPPTPPQHSAPAHTSDELPLHDDWVVEHPRGSGSATCSMSRAAGVARDPLACDGLTAGPGSGSGKVDPSGALTEEVHRLGEVELAPCGPLAAPVLRAGARVSLSEPWTRVTSHSMVEAATRAASPGVGDVRVPSGRRPCRVLRAASVGASWKGRELVPFMPVPGAAAAAGEDGVPLAARVQGGYGGTAPGGLDRSVRSGRLGVMKLGEGRSVGGFQGLQGGRGGLGPGGGRLVPGGCTVLTVQAAAMSTAPGTVGEAALMLDTTASIGSDCSPAPGSWAAMLGMDGPAPGQGPGPLGPRLQQPQPQQDQQQQQDQRDRGLLPVFAQAGSSLPPKAPLQEGASPGRLLMGVAGRSHTPQGPSRAQELRTGSPAAAVPVPAAWRPPPSPPPHSAARPSLDLTGSSTSSLSVPDGYEAEAGGTGWSEEDAAEHSSAPARAPAQAATAAPATVAALPPSLTIAGREAAAGAAVRRLPSNASGPASVHQQGAAGANASVSALGPGPSPAAVAVVAPAAAAVSSPAPLYARQAEGGHHHRLMQRVAAPQALTQVGDGGGSKRMGARTGAGLGWIQRHAGWLGALGRVAGSPQEFRL